MQHRVRSHWRRLADGRMVRIPSHMRSNRFTGSRPASGNSMGGLIVVVLIVIFLAYAASKGHL
jgi:hypothetical protein